LGIFGFAISAYGLQNASPGQEMPAIVVQVTLDPGAQDVDSIVLVVRHEKAEAPAEASAESTQSGKSDKEEKPGLAEKTRKGVTALRIMGRVGSGLLKNFMENLLGGV